MPLPLKVPPSFRIIAHRGASAYAPENTRPAFDLARKMGRTEIETDTQLTTNGQVVLCHDHTLERYGHGKLVVEETAWSQLSNLDMGAWFSPFLHGGEKMMTLAELLAAYGPSLTYHIELKGQAAQLPAAVNQTIQAHGLESHCIITSFSYPSLAAMHQVNPGLRLGWLVPQIDADSLAQATALGLFQLCPRANSVNPTAVAQAKAVVPEVRAWGMSGSPSEVRTLIRAVVESGCDGMTIDWPDWVAG